MSGQYSSDFPVQVAGTDDCIPATWPRSATASVTSRLIAFESTLFRSLCSPVSTLPSGSVIRREGTAELLKVARNPNRVGHFLGFLAVATFPSERSRRP